MALSELLGLDMLCVLYSDGLLDWCRGSWTAGTDIRELSFPQFLINSEAEAPRGEDQCTRALEAAEAAVRTLEDDTFFNAGHGSVLTIDDTVQMDALVSAFFLLCDFRIR